MNIKKEFSIRLRQTRSSKKLTQEQAAELLDIGIRWYQKIEDPKNIGLPGFGLCCKLAKHFDFDFSSFADLIEEEAANQDFFSLL